MNRETLLDDAITKAKEAEDWQLVEWLRMARGGESAVRWYTEKLRDANCTIRKLLNENAELRELVRDMWNGMCGYGHDCRSCEHYELFAGQRFVGECEFFTRMRELGIEVP